MSSINVDKYEKLRSAGRLEQWSKGRYSNRDYLHNVGVSCSYFGSNSRSNSRPDLRSLKDAIFSAVRAVINKHPILSATLINGETEAPFFMHLPKIDLNKVIRYVKRGADLNTCGKDDGIDRLLESELHKTFKTDPGRGLLPFWRLVILIGPNSNTDFVATFVYHHGIGDGMSGVIFHNSFWSALNTKNPPISCSIVRPSRTPLLPNLEMVHDMDVSPYREPEIDIHSLWSGDVMQPVASGGYFRSTAFAKDVTDRFVQACRRNGTTVTATLQVIIAVSLFRAVPYEFTRLRCSTPVNIRQWLPSPITSKSIGVFIDAVYESYHREDLPSFSWSDARASRECIQDHLDQEGRYLACAELKYIQGLNHSMLSCIGKKRTSSFEVSNLGRVSAMKEDAKEGGWRRGRMVFGQSAAAQGSALSCTAITGIDGCLVVGYSWQAGIVDDKVVAKVMKRVAEEINRLST